VTNRLSLLRSKAFERFQRKPLKALPIKDYQLYHPLARQCPDYKRPQLSQTTIAKDFDRVRLNIRKFPPVKLADAVVIRDHLVKNTSPNTAKRVLSKLTAACNWGILSNLVDRNPFIGMSADIKSVNKNDEEDINYFTPEERNLIVQRLKDNRSHYAPLVEFLFRTGCRPSEAIALQIKHLGKEYRSITFWALLDLWGKM
jgi:integrase